MPLQDIMYEIENLIQAIAKDVQKARRLNKTASQRIRTNTIKLEKVAKKYRKESIWAEKSGNFLKKKILKKTHKKSSKKK